MALADGGWQGPVKPTYFKLPEPRGVESVSMATGQGRTTDPYGSVKTANDELEKTPGLWRQQYDYQTALYQTDVQRNRIRNDLESYFMENPDAMFNMGKDPYVQSKTKELNKIASQEVMARSMTGTLSENRRLYELDLVNMQNKGTSKDFHLSVMGGIALPTVVGGAPVSNESFAKRQAINMPMVTADGTPGQYSSVGDVEYKGAWEDYVVKFFKGVGSSEGYGKWSVLNQDGKPTFASTEGNSVEFIQREKYTNNRSNLQAAANNMLERLPDDVRRDIMQQYWGEAYSGTLIAPEFVEKGKKLAYAQDKDGRLIENAGWRSAIEKAKKGDNLTQEDLMNLREHQAWYIAGKANNNVDIFAETKISTDRVMLGKLGEGGSLHADAMTAPMAPTPRTVQVGFRNMDQRELYNADPTKRGYNTTGHEQWRNRAAQLPVTLDYWNNPNVQDMRAVNEGLQDMAKSGKPIKADYLGDDAFYGLDFTPNDLSVLRESGAVLWGFGTQAVRMYQPVREQDEQGRNDWYLPSTIDRATDEGKATYVRAYFAIPGDKEGLVDPASDLKEKLRVFQGSNRALQVGYARNEDLPDQADAEELGIKSAVGDDDVTMYEAWVKLENVNDLMRTPAGKQIATYGYPEATNKGETPLRTVATY